MWQTKVWQEGDTKVAILTIGMTDEDGKLIPAAGMVHEGTAQPHFDLIFPLDDEDEQYARKTLRKELKGKVHDWRAAPAR